MTDVREAERGLRFSRRRFLGTFGAGAAGAAGAVAFGPSAPAAASPAGTDGLAATAVGEHRFSRMFQLPPFATDSPRLQAALLEIGKPGGMLDAGDPLEHGPVQLIVDPSLSPYNRDNPTQTAGVTFLGQFLDHDMTFDGSSPLGKVAPPEATRNFRNPALDLDSVYGDGPVANSELYDPADPAKFRIESGGRFEDLPRQTDNRAVLVERRNDENLVIAGIHLAMLRFHNNAVDYVRSRRRSSDDSRTFDAARQFTTWHYQWMIVHEFLPQIVGQATVDAVLSEGRRYYTPSQPAMPVEFQGAAYRFGHSMVRPSYRANLDGHDGGPFFGFVFDLAQSGNLDPDDLSGGCRGARRFIDWQTFFDFGDGEARPNKRIDTKISSVMFQLPPGVIPTAPGAAVGPTSLPQRNLLRHITWELPSGQRLAWHMGLPVLSRADLADLSGFGINLDKNTPLWFYVLREAEVMEDGLHLGPMGGRIVAEVILGLIQTDPRSYLSVNPSWRPVAPTRAGGGDFRMVDLLTFAGVDPDTRRG